MAEYPSIVLTNAGLDMIAESQAGQNLIFTKLKIGDGTLATGESIAALTGLKSFKLDVPIQGFLNQGNGQVRLRYLVDNSGVEANKGFFMREVGVYAKVTESGTEKLYAYTNGGNRVDWIPDLNTPMDAHIFDIFVLIGNASNVTININGSATYATKLDLTEHNESAGSHAGLFLPIPGGTLTGPLVLAADPTADMQAATKQYADNNGGVNLRKSSHTYAVGDICYSKTAASYKYMQCLVAGTTAAIEPTSWPDVGQTAVDGGVTWVVRDIRNNGVPVGTITMRLSNTPGPGELALDTGAEVSRAAYPQLWAWVQQYAPLISETDWQVQAAVQTSVGAYSTGDGSTTFRLPRILDYPRGGVYSEVGTWQEDMFKAHSHNYTKYSMLQGQGTQYNQWYGTATGETELTGGSETRPKTIKFLFCVKAFDAPTDQGLIDITELVNEVAEKVPYSDFLGSNQNKALSGWQKLPGGLILQWGQATAASTTTGSITVTLPIAFPNAVICAFPVDVTESVAVTLFGSDLGAATTSTLKFWWSTSAAGAFRYWAIGY